MNLINQKTDPQQATMETERQGAEESEPPSKISENGCNLVEEEMIYEDEESANPNKWKIKSGRKRPHSAQVNYMNKKTKYTTKEQNSQQIKDQTNMQKKQPNISQSLNQSTNILEKKPQYIIAADISQWKHELAIISKLSIVKPKLHISAKHTT